MLKVHTVTSMRPSHARAPKSVPLYGHDYWGTVRRTCR